MRKIIRNILFTLVLVSVILGGFFTWRQWNKSIEYNAIVKQLQDTCSTMTKPDQVKIWLDQSLYEHSNAPSENEIVELKSLVDKICANPMKQSYWSISDGTINAQANRLIKIQDLSAELSENEKLAKAMAEFSYAYLQKEFLFDAGLFAFGFSVPVEETKLYDVYMEYQDYNSQLIELAGNPDATIDDLQDAIRKMDELRTAFVESWPAYKQRSGNINHPFDYYMQTLEKRVMPTHNAHNYGKFPPLMPDRLVDVKLSNNEITEANMPKIVLDKVKFVRLEHSGTNVAFTYSMPYFHTTHEVKFTSQTEDTFDNGPGGLTDYNFTTDPNTYCNLEKLCWQRSLDGRIWYTKDNLHPYYNQLRFILEGIK